MICKQKKNSTWLLDEMLGVHVWKRQRKETQDKHKIYIDIYKKHKTYKWVRWFFSTFWMANDSKNYKSKRCTTTEPSILKPIALWHFTLMTWSHEELCELLRSLVAHRLTWHSLWQEKRRNMCVSRPMIITTQEEMFLHLCQDILEKENT